MRVTRENAPELIAQGLLPEGDLIFHVRSGAQALPLPSLFKTRVRWLVEESQSTAVVTKESASFPPFTFYEWNELEVEEHEDGQARLAQRVAVTRLVDVEDGLDGRVEALHVERLVDGPLGLAQG